MSLDFQQVHEQVRKLGDNAIIREQRLKSLRQKAQDLLKEHAQDLDGLCDRIELVVKNYDSTLRCALPVSENLDAYFPLPPLPGKATILAADGSQINPDRHEPVEYCLINFGAIRMHYGEPDTPQPIIESKLLYGDQLYTTTGTLTEAALALTRDLNERTLLAQIAINTPAPVITFTDGQMELYGARIGEEQTLAEFRKSLEAYIKVLSDLNTHQVITAGYIDKPGADLVVRLLEIADASESDLADIHRIRQLRGVRDVDLFYTLLQPGDRSSVFALQSKSTAYYKNELALHFFYLNVGREGHPWLSRVEVPAWVAGNREMLDNLHAVLVHQCRMMGSRPYPYLLHRAHEAAVVSFQEKEQVTQMIALELRKRGVIVGEQSYKQAAKDSAARTRY